MQRPSEAPQTPPPTARLLVNVYNLSGEKLITFSQNVSLEGKDKWEELNIGLTANEAVQVEVICENTDKDNKPVFFDNLSVKVQTVPTVLVVQENHYYPFGLGMKGLDWVLPNGKEDKYSYNGKEKQADFDLGWSDYGARNYDSQIGRMTSVDRFAEKYYSLTSYQYAANNPISFIDVNGDSIWVEVNINGNVQKYYWGTYLKENIGGEYSNSSETAYGFLDSKGNVYNGTDNFVSQVTNGLMRLMLGKAGGTLVMDLANSNQNMRIMLGANGELADPKYPQYSSYVKWDPNGGGVLGNQRPAYIGLGHELAHTQDRWQNGQADMNTWFSVGNVSIPYAEIYATHIENQIRAEHNVGLRTHYAYDVSGNGTGEAILFSGTRESRYYNATGVTNPNYNVINKRRGQTPFTY